jgi:hypothetical protein
MINRLYLMAAVDVMQGFACDVHAVLIPLAIATLIGLGLSALLPDDAPRVQLQGDHQQHHNLAAGSPWRQYPMILTMLMIVMPVSRPAI